MNLRASLLVGCLLLTSCSGKPEDQWASGESGHVARILDGDTFALNTGLVVRLVSVEAPQRATRNRDGQAYGEEAAAVLERLALGRRVELYYPGMTEDRYDRALAQVFVETESGLRLWLNEELVRQGAAWVRVYADTSLGSDALWEAEREARLDGKGLWKESSPMSSTDEISEFDGVFTIFNGSIEAAFPDDDRCMAQVLDTNLKIAFDASSGDCEVPANIPVEIRGWARNGIIYVGDRSNFRSVLTASGRD